MRMRRNAVVLATGLAMALGLAPATAHANSAPAASAAAAATTAVSWGACSDASLAKAGAQCALLSVPLDYSRPSGTKIQIAISRVRHTVPAAKYQGVILVNPGGPGGSGLGLATLGSAVPNHVGDAYDWIGFDPRGVGASVPSVSCDPNYFGFNRPPYVPTSAKIENAWLAKTKGYAQACGRNNGPILNHVTTLDTVRDMDRIRAALGRNQINYYGFSYGTYLGQVYGTVYPGRLRRMVLDSNVDPRQVWYQSNLAQDPAFDRNIDIWFGWIARHDSVYHLGKTQTAVRNLWYGTQAKLARHPAGGKIGPAEWTDAFLFAGYYQLTWLDEADTFARYIHDNDVANLVQHYVDANGLGDDNGYAMYLATECTDAPWPKSFARTERDNWRVYLRAPFETWANAWYNDPCRNWPAASSHPVTVDGSKVASALLIDETLDAATPYEGSLEVRKLFPNSSLIALPGGTSHAVSLFGNACEDNQIAAYLLDGTLPARKSGNRADTTCAPLPQPVPTAAAAPSVTAGSATGRPALRALIGR